MREVFVRIFLIGLALGLYMNLLGWLGNNLLLGSGWDAAGLLITTDVQLPYPPLARELISLAPDFIYGLTMAWLYAQTSDRSLLFSFKFAAVFWTATVGVVYLAIVNSRFLPIEIAVQTTILALAIGAPIVFVLPRLLPAKR